MNIIKKISITNFWGSRNFSIDLHSNINFFIGVNGSGKTTLINIISACLNGDLVRLSQLPFARFKLDLVKPNEKTNSFIEITKSTSKKPPFSTIKCTVNENGNLLEETHDPDQIARHTAIGDLWFYRNDVMRFSSTLTEKIKKIANVSWLSIHRSNVQKNTVEERGYESTVDKKLNDLATEFVKYFSSLTGLGDDEMVKFQKTVFRSLIPNESERELFLAVQSLNLEEERKALIDIFRKFNIHDSEESIKTHFSALENVVRKLRTPKPGITPQELVAIVSAWRIQAVVQDWNKRVKTQRKIFEPRDTFISIANSLLQRKTLRVNNRNELAITTQSGKDLALTELSSGEKQLLIILGEALIQEKKPWIYIADEPELSLHVNWQSQLITCLRKINPSAQIVFATHSPDIVSIYGKNVFDMEKILP